MKPPKDSKEKVRKNSKSDKEEQVLRKSLKKLFDDELKKGNMKTLKNPRPSLTGKSMISNSSWRTELTKGTKFQKSEKKLQNGFSKDHKLAQPKTSEKQKAQTKSKEKNENLPKRGNVKESVASMANGNVSKSNVKKSSIKSEKPKAKRIKSEKSSEKVKHDKSLKVKSSIKRDNFNESPKPGKKRAAPAEVDQWEGNKKRKCIDEIMAMPQWFSGNSDDDSDYTMDSVGSNVSDDSEVTTDNSSYDDEDNDTDDDSSFYDSDLLTDFNSDWDDSDYVLPEDVLEDIIRPPGCSRPLRDDENVEFDDTDNFQIIEIPMEKDEECPGLVPIKKDEEDDTDEDDWKSYDGCSITSEDVNMKYMEEIDGIFCEAAKPIKMKADVIKASNIDANPPIPLAQEKSDEELVEEPNEPFVPVTVVKDAKVEIVEVALTQSETESQKNKKKVLKKQYATEIFDKTQPAPPSVVPEVPFRSILCSGIDNNDVLALLKDPIYLYGTVRMSVVIGEVEVYGYTADDRNPLEIFSPRGFATVSVAAKPSGPIDPEKLDKVKENLRDHFPIGEVARIFANYEPSQDAIVHITYNAKRKKMVNFFKLNMNENVFPNVEGSSRFPEIDRKLRCIIRSEDASAVTADPAWSQLQLEGDTRMMICGGKAVGKSTLLRFMVNRHLDRFDNILVIDLDIGQSELFVPQTVSCFAVSEPLLGPGFFLNEQPIKSFMVGGTNVTLCGHSYLRAVRRLLDFCHSHPVYSQLPWLINTMGYNKGFGIELLSFIAQYVRPTIIVQLQSTKDINNFDTKLTPQVLNDVRNEVFMDKEFCEKDRVPLDYELFVFQSKVRQDGRYQKEWEMGPKDIRYAMTLARLSDALQKYGEWLTDVRPVSAVLDEIEIINLAHPNSSREELIKAAEANLVYLCHLPETEKKSPYAVPECMGIGAVRGIDYHVRHIYLLPAMPLRNMASVNCLVLSEVPLPTSVFTNQGPKVKNLAPYMYNTVQEKATKNVKQIYHRPQQFLSGKHREL